MTKRHSIHAKKILPKTAPDVIISASNPIFGNSATTLSSVPTFTPKQNRRVHIRTVIIRPILDIFLPLIKNPITNPTTNEPRMDKMINISLFDIVDFKFCAKIVNS